MIMTIVSHCAKRLIVIGAFIVIASAFASASDLKNDASFKLAMGPTSAAQKNQSGSADIAPGEAQSIPRHHHTHHRMRPSRWHSM